MNSARITRRDFLKLMGASSLLLAGDAAQTRWPGTDNQVQNRLPGASTHPNVLVLVFDTLSARNMSLYGYQRGTTPNLERFAERATVFQRHYASANFTTPGTASLLTGTYPWSHRALHLHGTVDSFYTQHNLFSLLAGIYSIFAYTHNPMAYILLSQFREYIHGLARISDLCLVADTNADKLFNPDFGAAYDGELLMFRNGAFPSGTLFLSLLNKIRRFVHQFEVNGALGETLPRGVPNYMDEELPSFLYFTLEDTVDWLQTQVAATPAPFLGYIHVLPPHGPYATRLEYLDRFDDGWQPPAKPEHFFSEGHTQEFLTDERRFYDEGIAYVDAEFGRVYDYLEGEGFLENTYLIVTSDHGEMFERGIYTHITPTLYEPLIHIPLLISRPGQRQREDISSLTNNVDLLPTLLHIAGLPVPEWCEGQILPMFGANVESTQRSIYVVEGKENPKRAPMSKATIALLEGDYKLIHYFGYDGFSDEYELYDLEADPEELENLFTTNLSVAAGMQDALAKKLTAASQEGK